MSASSPVLMLKIMSISRLDTEVSICVNRIFQALGADTSAILRK